MLKRIIKALYRLVFHPVASIENYKIKSLAGSPQKLSDYLYQRDFNRHINWKEPVELNEKIRWIMFNTEISLWTRLADKYLARFYVDEKGYSNILVKLYGVWDNANEIDFSALPNSFVLKTNHGCGEVIVVKDKSKIDIEEIRKKMNSHLDNVYGIRSAEFHYLAIPRKIIAEELLPATANFSKTIVDYKFYCFYGEPFMCGVFYDRSDDHITRTSYYDMKWKLHPEWLESDKRSLQKDIPQPFTFEKMKQACRDLCKNMPFCRLDFYEVNDRLYFGEFTFTPAACSGGSLDKDFCIELGGKLVLPPIQPKNNSK